MMGRVGRAGAGAGRAGWIGLALALALALVAQGGRLAAEGGTPQPLSGAAAQHLRGVAALSAGGRRACSAVLIAADQAVSAAHCVAHLTPGDVTLDFGLGGPGPVVRRGLRAILLAQGYAPDRPAARLEDLANDLALLVLQDPVQPAEALPLAVADWTDPRGDFVDILGLQRDGPEGPVWREGCMALGGAAGVVVLDCDVVAGLSGAAVLLQRPDGAPPALAAVVSSRAEGRSYVVTLAPALAALQARAAR